MRTIILKDAYGALLKRIEEINREIKENTKDIARAASFGDLSENAEYDAAKEKQSELFLTLSNLQAYTKARIIDEADINTQVVSFGTTIKLYEFNSNEIQTYTVAGPVEFELEIYPSIMTFTSPLGQALIGKKKGAIVEIELPKGKSKFIILDIKAVSSIAKPDPDLVIFGHIGYDTIHVDDSEKGKFVAGSAYYSGVGASCFSDCFALITRVAKSDSELYEAARALNCLMDGVRKVEDKESSSFKLLYSSNGGDKAANSRKRVDFSYGCGSDITFDDFPREYYSAPFIHISSAHPEQQLKWISAVKKSEELDCQISIDISESHIGDHKETLKEALSHCDIVFVNENERRLLSDCGIDEKVIVIRKEKNIAELWIDGDLQKESESPDGMERIDPTGYGGVMAGAFMSLLAMGHDEETALEVALRISSKSAEKYGVNHLLCRSGE